MTFQLTNSFIGTLYFQIAAKKNLYPYNGLLLDFPSIKSIKKNVIIV